MAEQEDNHFVAHPEGGVTTESQIAAEKANAVEPQAEVTIEPTTEPTVEPEVKPEEEVPATDEPVIAEPADELDGKEPVAEPAE